MNTLLHVAEWWSRTLWALSWQIGILVGLVWLASLLFRRASPNFRYWLWVIVLVRLCLPINLALPAGLSGDVRHAVETSAPAAYLAVQRAAVQPVMLPPKTEASMPAATVAPVPKVSPETHPLPVARPALPLGVKLVLGWAAVSLSILTLVFVKHLRVRRVLRSWREAVRPDLLSLVDSLRSRCAIRRVVRVRVFPAEHPLQGPAVVGIVRPTIVLPAAVAEDWSLDELEPVLLHELAHIKRWDLLVNLVQMIVQAVYFFHPLVWLANARIRQERELVCDDLAVLHTGGRCKRYSQSFVRVLEETASDAPFLEVAGVGMMERRKPLARRIIRMMSKDYRIYRPLGWLSTALLLTVSAAAIAVAAERAGFSEAAKSPSSSNSLVVAPLVGYLNDAVKADWQPLGITGDMAVFGKLQDQTIEILRQRLDRAGLRDVKIERRANGHIALQIPPKVSAARMSSLAVEPGVTRFFPVASHDETIEAVKEVDKDSRFQGRIIPLLDAKARQDFLSAAAGRHAELDAVLKEINQSKPSPLPEGKMFLLGSKVFPEALYLVDKNSPMEWVKVRSAVAIPDENHPGVASINFAMSDADAQRFGDLTQSLLGKALAIVVDWELQSAPVVRDRINGSGQITGNYTMEEAKDLAARMWTPEYPVPVVVLPEPVETSSAPAPTETQDVRKSLEERHYEGLDEGVLNRMLVTSLLPVFDPATGEQVSTATYDKAARNLTLRNLPENLNAFEALLAKELGVDSVHPKPDEKPKPNDAPPPAPDASAPQKPDIEGGYTHLVTFEPAGEFHPQTPRELLDVFNGVCKSRTGYFRTKAQDGKLLGRICTDAPDELKRAFEREPRLKWIEAVVLTPELFAQHSATRQESCQNSLEMSHAWTH